MVVVDSKQCVSTENTREVQRSRKSSEHSPLIAARLREVCDSISWMSSGQSSLGSGDSALDGLHHQVDVGKERRSA